LKKFRMLSVGRMSRGEYCEDYRDPTDLYKGFRAIVEALDLLVESGIDAFVEFVGDGDARPELEDWVGKQSVASRVFFRGRVSDADLGRFYTECDAFVLPSECEGFGLVFVEAMSCGKPCVCVAAGAAPEVVTDDQNGYVARARDSYDLADRLRVIALNTSARQRLAAGAADSYKRIYTHRCFLERLGAALTRESACEVGR
jgi:glycosyltransferase involved in cell wall biosynthesis